MIKFNRTFEQFPNTYTLEKPTLAEVEQQPEMIIKLINELRRLGFKGKKYVIDEGLFFTCADEIDGFIGRKFWHKFRVNGDSIVHVPSDFNNEIDYIEFAAKAISEVLKNVTFTKK